VSAASRPAVCKVLIERCILRHRCYPARLTAYNKDVR
jgi:hypothetical protein